MPEIKSVVKSFIIALVVVMCLQVKIGSVTLENHAQEWIHTSSVAQYLQGTAEGAALMLRNAGHSISGFVGKTFGHRHHSVQAPGETQKAGRLNIEFKRSPAFESSNKKSEDQ